MLLGAQELPPKRGVLRQQVHVPMRSKDGVSQMARRPQKRVGIMQGKMARNANLWAVPSGSPAVRRQWLRSMRWLAPHRARRRVTVRSVTMDQAPVNAALLSASILGGKHPQFSKALQEFRTQQTDNVLNNPDPRQA